MNVPRPDIMLPITVMPGLRRISKRITNRHTSITNLITDLHTKIAAEATTFRQAAPAVQPLAWTPQGWVPNCFLMPDPLDHRFYAEESTNHEERPATAWQRLLQDAVSSGARKGEWENMASNRLRLLLAAAAGFAAAIVVGWVIIMPPSDMIRWIGSNEPVRDRLARVFSPAGHIVELRAAVAKAGDTLAICKADQEEQRRRADELEFKVSAATARPEGAPKEAAASCARDYASVRGIKLKQGETVRHLGGRIYVGLQYVSSTEHWCRVRVSSDTKRSYGPDVFMALAEPLYVESSMGKFRLIVTKHVYNYGGNSWCEFDLLREP